MDMALFCWWACEIVDMVAHIPWYHMLFLFVVTGLHLHICRK